MDGVYICIDILFYIFLLLLFFLRLIVLRYGSKIFSILKVHVCILVVGKPTHKKKIGKVYTLTLWIFYGVLIQNSYIDYYLKFLMLL